MSIHGFRIGSTELLLRRLNDTHYDFFLTGSRYFRDPVHVDPASDYDLYTQDTPEVREVLEMRGFRIHSDPDGSYDEDPNTVVVYRHSGVSPHIDVQLVKDLDLKHRVQNVLHSMGVLAGPIPVDKRTAKRCWSTLMWTIAHERGKTQDLRY